MRLPVSSWREYSVERKYLHNHNPKALEIQGKTKTESKRSPPACLEKSQNKLTEQQVTHKELHYTKNSVQFFRKSSLGTGSD